MIDLDNFKHLRFKSGSHFKVYLANEQSLESWKGLVSSCKNDQGKTAISNLGTKIQKFCDGHRLHSPEEINDEGDHFFAFKNAYGLRAYCWFCDEHRGVIWISHFVHKKKGKLKPADKVRMTECRTNHYEEERG